MTVSLTKRPTHQDGLRVVDKIAADHGIDAVELRWFASHHLSEQMRDWLGDDHGHGIGSSDVSIHLSSLGNYEPEVLRQEAARIQQRNAIVNSVAESTGKSKDEVLESFRRLLAPA